MNIRLYTLHDKYHVCLHCLVFVKTVPSLKWNAQHAINGYFLSSSYPIEDQFWKHWCITCSSISKTKICIFMHMLYFQLQQLHLLKFLIFHMFIHNISLILFTYSTNEGISIFLLASFVKDLMHMCVNVNLVCTSRFKAKIGSPLFLCC